MKRTLCLLLAAALLCPTLARAQDDDETTGDPSDAPLGLKLEPPPITSGRVSFVAGGILLLGGIGLGYLAQGQGQRASSVGSAVDARENLRQAQSTAMTANLMYVLAGACILYGVALEVLPEPVAQKANLTFHF